MHGIHSRNCTLHGDYHSGHVDQPLQLDWRLQQHQGHHIAHKHGEYNSQQFCEDIVLIITTIISSFMEPACICITAVGSLPHGSTLKSRKDLHWTTLMPQFLTAILWFGRRGITPWCHTILAALPEHPCCASYAFHGACIMEKEARRLEHSSWHTL